MSIEQIPAFHVEYECMAQGFWKNLKKPIFALAPMADVTDPPFRHIIATYGKPDVMWTEFVSSDGLFSEGREKLLRDLKFSEIERPVVAQFFSSNPEYLYKSALLAQKLGFDGIDINMGCPDRSVEKQGSGAALIQNPELAKEIIKETKRGAGDIPVSVKTRIGYRKNEIETWIPNLLETEIAVLTVHLRTRKEMSKVPAHWELVPRIMEIRDGMGLKNKTYILGNGDVETLEDAEEKIKETGADGIMIGRGIFGNPWFFNKEVDVEKIPLKGRFRVMVEHARLFEDFFKDPENPEKLTKSFDVMKKHFKAYISGFDGAKELRMKLMAAQNSDEIESILEEEFPKLGGSE